MKNEPKLYLLIGCPGSGKTTFGKKYAKDNNIMYLSSDELRAAFGKNEEDQSVTPRVFEHIRYATDEYLSKKISLMIDATNINKRDRKNYIDTANTYGIRVVAYVFEQPRRVLIDRNQKRGENGGRNVPVHVIDKMLNKYETPTYKEGFDEIIYV
jgi:protein phosphatase